MNVSVSQPCCVLCGSQALLPLWETSDQKFRGPGRFTYVRCNTCGIVFLHPRPPAHEMCRYYPDHVTPVRKDTEASLGERTRRYLKRIVAEDWYGYSLGSRTISRQPLIGLRKALTFALRPLLRQVPPHRLDGRVLDIGCGSGGYLAFLAGLGWSCYGVETGAKSRAYAQEVLGLTVHPGPLEACGFPDGFFDVVTMWHVIEHLADPIGTFREIHRILKPDGAVLLRTPNIDSWEARWFRANWYGMDSPRHVCLFSPDTLHALLGRSGFAVTASRYQYHPVDCSRSLLYVLEERGWPRLHAFVSSKISLLELGLTLCSPFRRAVGRGGAFHVEARKVSR